MVLREQIARLTLMKAKFGIHVVQAVLTIISWMLTIAVIAKPGGNSSAIYWYFFLTWMTLIALAYQALIPLWERTKRFKNVYACFAIDAVFTIFWIAAFASVQVWTASGVPSDSTGYCQGFTYGDQSRCTISNGTVILGVLIFLLFLVAAGISGYKVWYFRKNGYCPSQRPSISKPVQPKFVYPEPSQAPSDHGDLEKGGLTISTTGAHPGRKLSWDAAPLSAPACAPEFPEAKPTFRTIDYNAPAPTERSPLTQHPPISRRPVTNNYMAAPKLNVYGPGDRTPALIMDYGATTPYGPPDPYAPQSRYSNYNPYPVTPAPQQNFRGSFAPAPAPYTAGFPQNPYGNVAGSHQSYMGGYRNNYASGIHPNAGYGGFQDRRGSTIRSHMPAPASQHAGGYHSAYHTPLPSALMSPSRRGDGYHGFKRESTVQFYSQQQAFSAQDRYGAPDQYTAVDRYGATDRYR